MRETQARERAADRVYFPNLNGIRFLAASAVVVHHVAQLQAMFKLPSLWGNATVRLLGPLGVILFFVLSGFLITYLLLVERKALGTIAIKAFYMRRILRIWPLYYLILLLGFVVMPRISFMAMPGLTERLGEHAGLRAFLYFAFLPNVGICLPPAVPFASQAWSVGVEEQFYLLWPNVLRRARQPLPTLVGVIAVYLAIRVALLVANKVWPSTLLGLASTIWSQLSIDCMAIGGIAACLLFERREAILRPLFSRPVQLGTYAVTILLIGFGVDFSSLPLLHHLTFEIYAVLFAVLLLNLAANPASLVSLECPPLRYLGKISYGIYMFHPLAITAAIVSLSALGHASSPAIHTLSALLTLLLAALSYSFFERPFLRVKTRFTTVASGDDVRNRRDEAPTPSDSGGAGP
jgi:peptidoglycan/LPS O-acetylase OafA/YrhL